MTRAGATNDFVTVVSGLPRSGTSLMMQMLRAGGLAPLTDDARAADASNPRGYLELDAVKRTRQDAGWVREAPGRAVKVIHLLLEHLPPTQRYRVILMTRPLTEVLASQARMLERDGRRGAALPPARLEAVFRAQLEKARALLASAAHFDALEVGFAETIAAPHATADRVRAFLGLDLDTAAMAARVDPTLYRERG
jgi:hypothetical protein